MNLDDHVFKGLKFHELIAAIDHTTCCLSDKATTKVGLSQDFLLWGCWEVLKVVTTYLTWCF